MSASQYLMETLLALLLLGMTLGASEATRRSARIYPPDASQRRIPLTVCPSGISTLLWSGGISRSARHNGNDGEAHFVLKDKVNSSVLWKDEYVGQGICFGFNHARRIYVLGTRREQGIGVRLTDLRYIEEAARRSQLSAFDRKKIEAFVAVPSPGLRYLALIAMEDNEFSLFVLDVEKETC